MVTKCKFRGKHIKSSYEDILEGYKKIYPGVNALYSYNYKLYKNAYKFAEHYYTQCHKTKSKVLSEPTGISASANSFKNYADLNNKGVFPVVGENEICSYLAQHEMSNLQIQAVLEFDGRLDLEKLNRTVRLSIDAEPILGCRFVKGTPPHWKRLDNLDEAEICSIEEDDNTDYAVKKFLQSPLDINDPNLKVKVIRSKQNDVIVLKINYACCDAAGAKEYIQLLSDIYSSIGQDDGTFNPEPEISPIGNQDRFFKALNEARPESNLKTLSGTAKNMWQFQWTQRAEDSIGFSICRLPYKSLDSIYFYRNLKGASLNDLLLTAFYRAMGKITRPLNGIPMAIAAAADLRSYLPGFNTQIISNLTGGYITRVPLMWYDSFANTLTKVIHETEIFREKNTVVETAQNVNTELNGNRSENVNAVFSHNFYKLIEQASEASAQSASDTHDIHDTRETFIPGLINSGSISDSFIRFGDSYVIDAYFVPPVIREPGFLLLASSYNDILTLSLGYNGGSVNQRDMDWLLNKIKCELVRGC